MYYLIREKLENCDLKDIQESEEPYVAVLTADEWKQNRSCFSMNIDADLGAPSVALTRVAVSYDVISGTINVPSLGYSEGHEQGYFTFALDERGVVFIDHSGLSEHITSIIAEHKRWRMPSLERFLYDFLEQLISPDLSRLWKIELKLESMEKEILAGNGESMLSELNEIRGNLLDMDLHYSQLTDLGLELEENESDFFEEDNLRFFHMFTLRVERLREMVDNLREYSIQLRDLIQTRVDVKQNRIITLLTVITTIFTPLTLLTGWYGMNFKYMPELNYKWSYPVVIAVSLAIALGCLAYFKKKKWM